MGELGPDVETPAATATSVDDDPSEPVPRLGSLQHERAALWVIVRYLPVLIGLVLTVSFGSSVLYDNEDLAHCSWSSGGELLGAFGDFSRLMLVPLFLASAFLKRGPRCLVRLIEVTDDHVLLEDETGKIREIPRDAVRSVFSFKTGNMVSLAIELSRGLFLMSMQGDKLTLELDPADAKRVMKVFATDEVDIRLGTKSPRFGGVLIALSLVIGTAIGVSIFRSMWSFVQHLPRPSTYLPIVPDAERGWLAGLAITSMGVTHGVMAWLSSPGEMVLGPKSLTLKSSLGPRSIAYRDIVGIATTWRGFVIELASEERIERTRLGIDPERLSGFIDALRERVAKARDEVPVPSGLERGSARVTEWRRTLARRARAGAYRVGALDSETLLACVTGSAVPRDVRIGAAIALSSANEGHDRERLREAASDEAHPRLRALYEQLAEGEADDEDIEALLKAKR